MLLCFSTWVCLARQGVVNLAFEDARPIVQALDEVAPQGLRGLGAADQAAAWPKWLARFENMVRERMVRGDEDTLVNFLMFGTSYTRQPRLAPTDFRPDNISKTVPGIPLSVFPARSQDLVKERLGDLLRALGDPKGNDRIAFFRLLLTQRGFKPGDASDSIRIQAYILDNLFRVLKEAAGYAASLEAARKPGNASAEFAERSTLFRDRGLSVDTSLRPGFALEEALKAMMAQKLLVPDSIRRVAIIGPGLDFADKDAGYDFYPPQTIQPLALIDTLARLGLAKPDAVEVTTLDVSAKVNDHINRARQRAGSGIAYSLQLPRDTRVSWSRGYLRYWENFGDQIGRGTPSAAPPQGVTDTVVRSVTVRPGIVMRLRPVELNIVTQHLALADAQRFDMIVATNMFVYYDVFEQSVALANVERMLRPGGFLLSNNALLELPFSKIRSVGYQGSAYSDRSSDGDNIVFYRRND
jgi:hypothetical protein